LSYGHGVPCSFIWCVGRGDRSAQQILRKRPAGQVSRTEAGRRSRQKRGGGRRVDLDRLTGLAAASDDDLLGLDDGLDRLAKDYPAAAALVQLRFFAGMTLGEAADALAVP